MKDSSTLLLPSIIWFTPSPKETHLSCQLPRFPSLIFPLNGHFRYPLINYVYTINPRGNFLTSTTITSHIIFLEFYTEHYN